MSLLISDTLSGKKRPLEPRNPGKVDIYICGITPYSDTHLGHARPSVFWDSATRYLAYRGWRVTVVQNVTDVNEKVLARAQLEGVSERELACRYYKSYEALMERLGVRPPDAAPWVSDHIEAIIESIEDLIESDHAYTVDGDVYFDVTSFADYGRLSGQLPEDLRAGARLEVDDRKRHPADFALWKAVGEDIPSWESPWGRGRPGWHIECSAMSREYLGFGFDIHAGGSDLLFPHHENERAQSESISGCQGPQARYWVHHGMVTGEDGKMSKSLGNFVTVEEVLEEFPPQVLRLFLLSAHYSKPLTYSEERMRESSKAWGRLRQFLETLDAAIEGDSIAQETVISRRLPSDMRELADALNLNFCRAMDDDLNTARAIAAVFETIREANARLNAPNFAPTGDVLQALEDLRDALEICGRILGIWPDEDGGGEESVDASRESDLLDLLTELRERAREDKHWDYADMIRDRLSEMGYVLEDTPTGTRIKRGEQS